MEQLIKQTTAYRIFSTDRRGGALSHAYLLRFGDEVFLRAALRVFAAEFFGGGGDVRRRVESGTMADYVIYPQEGQKITADGISEIIADSALRPVAGEKKLYVICGFESASVIVQNKLLKTLEEPPLGVHFLLGATTTAPLTDTVMSRVKLLEMPPFSEEAIFAALERRGQNPMNAIAAKNADGVLGAAVNIIEGGWFKEVEQGARAICTVRSVGEIAAIAQKYGETKYKRELLSEIRRRFFRALKGEEELLNRTKASLVYALEQTDKAAADIKFNAFFQGLLFDFMLRLLDFEARQTV